MRGKEKLGEREIFLFDESFYKKNSGVARLSYISWKLR